MKITPRTPSRIRAHIPSATAGFSLAELMVVIVIIALLATFVANNALPYLMKANATKAKADIAAICTAIDTFTIDNGGRYPDSLEILVTPDENGITYLKDLTTVPLDPWKNAYAYEPPSGGMGPYKVFSYGKDGQPGGEGDEADISNISMREQSK
jgi:general secretion pathway protein G